MGRVAVKMAKLENSLDDRLRNIESLIRANHSANSSVSDPSHIEAENLLQSFGNDEFYIENECAWQED